MMSVQEFAAKWKKNLLAATETIKQGVQSVTVSPTEKAAKRKDAYVAGVQAAADSGKWEAGLRRVNLGQWQDAMIKKGVPNLNTGTQQAISKVEAFAAELLPYTARVKETIAQMPKGTDADSDARMLAAVQMMRQFRRRG